MGARQGEIYWIDFSPARGHEQRGRRPGLVLSRTELNSLPLTVLVMIGTGAEHLDPGRRYPTDLWTTAGETGLPKDTVFLGTQLRSLDHGRLMECAGSLPVHRLVEAQDIVRFVMGDDRRLSE